jgi:microcystin-dependent protein
MAKSTVSEWDVLADNNTRINGINIDENCPPSAINNAIREVMAQVKQWKDGYTDSITGEQVYQSLTVQSIDVKDVITLNDTAGKEGQVIVSKGSDASPEWGDAFVTGMIMLWSGSTESVPSGWALCNGANGTPDLRNRFVVGAGSTYEADTTGGSADATLPSHTHTGTSSSNGDHTHSVYVRNDNATNTNGDTLNRANTGILGDEQGSRGYRTTNGNSTQLLQNSSTHTHTITINSTGSSGTNKNLPPYYALAYIMKV